MNYSQRMYSKTELGLPLLSRHNRRGDSAPSYHGMD